MSVAAISIEMLGSIPVLNDLACHIIAAWYAKDRRLIIELVKRDDDSLELAAHIEMFRESGDG